MIGEFFGKQIEWLAEKIGFFTVIVILTEVLIIATGLAAIVYIVDKWWFTLTICLSTLIITIYEGITTFKKRRTK